MIQFDSLPIDLKAFSAWTWSQIAPYYDELLARPLTAANLEAWLTDWSRITGLLIDLNTHYTIATTINTADAEAERAYKAYLDEIVPPMGLAEQALKQKLIDSNLPPPSGFEQPMRKIRAEAALFNEANVPLLAEARKLSIDYEKIAGSQTVTWDGVEIPLVQLIPVLQNPDRARREGAFRTMMARVEADDEALASLWRTMVQTRHQIARNADFSDFRAYRWQQLFRFDYTPDDVLRFLDAIEAVAVPAASRLAEKRRMNLNIDTLRPWDINVDPANRAPLRPYQTIDELESGISAIFRQVDPAFADYFEIMRAEKLLDLDSRKNKSPGGYMLPFMTSGRPFIYMNGMGTHGDVTTLLHEGGHSFHGFEIAGLPYIQQKREEFMPMEFAEVASLAMELLGAPYLTQHYGGFYTESEAARARIEHLTNIIVSWPYMAMVDGLQHWIYTHPDEAADMRACDEIWLGLVDRFWPSLDWRGIEPLKRLRWHMQGHIFTDPFYYVEYGIAELGAVQVWANALKDQKSATAAYRRALALGATATLPELYAAAGAKFAFDAETLRGAIELIETTIAELEPLADNG